MGALKIVCRNASFTPVKAINLLKTWKALRSSFLLAMQQSSTTMYQGTLRAASMIVTVVSEQRTRSTLWTNIPSWTRRNLLRTTYRKANRRLRVWRVNTRRLCRTPLRQVMPVLHLIRRLERCRAELLIRQSVNQHLILRKVSQLSLQRWISLCCKSNLLRVNWYKTWRSFRLPRITRKGLKRCSAR